MNKRIVQVGVTLAVAAGMAVVWAVRTGGPPPVDHSLGPDDVGIDFWYGPDQTFGRLGEPQRWINVLGNVQPALQIDSATFSINGGPERRLSLGSDLHRLALAGDFNVEFGWDEVGEGENTVRVTVVLRNGAVASASTRVRVERGNRWPLPYHVDFSRVEDLQDVVQVVDGKWRLEPDGVRTAERYYDRVLTLGDTTWHDYEATVRLTVHDFTPPEPPPPTYDVTHFGVAMRWRGHDVDGRQPHRKWFPLGAQGEFLVRTSSDSSRWRLLFDEPSTKPQKYSEEYLEMHLGQPIRIRAQVATLPDGRTRYRFKKWTDAEPEPADWDIEGIEADDFPSGALCLVPHNTDVTIHEVRVEPLGEVTAGPGA